MAPSRFVRRLSWTLGGTLLLLGSVVSWIEIKGSQTHEDTPLPDIVASRDPAVIARGEYLFHHVMHCSTCHSASREEITGIATANYPAPSGGFTWDLPFGVLHSANITPDRETGVGMWTDAELARVIATGVRKNGELSAFMRLTIGLPSRDDLTAVVSYLRSLQPVSKRVPSSEMNLLGKAVVALGMGPREFELVDKAPSELGPERGKYLAEGPGMCFGCHTQLDPAEGFAPTGPAYAGSDPEPDPLDPDHEIVAPNLTPAGHLRMFSEDAFVHRFRAGRAIPGSKMPWEAFTRMQEDDLRSIYRYLQTVAAVDHDVGPTRRPLGWKPEPS